MDLSINTMCDAAKQLAAVEHNRMGDNRVLTPAGLATDFREFLRLVIARQAAKARSCSVTTIGLSFVLDIKRERFWQSVPGRSIGTPPACKHFDF